MTLSTGNLRQVYEALKDRQFYRGQYVGRGEVEPLMAEIVTELAPAWYVLQILPAHERIAAAHLAGRRFGVFLPEVEDVRIVRRQRVRLLKPMFVGYVFVFTWLAARNYYRIRSCPGVFDFVCADGRPAMVPDAAVNAVRAVENKQRPLTVEQEGIGVFRKVKRRWRRHRTVNEQVIPDNDIVGVHTWSALRDGLEQAVDNGKRTQLLLTALGVAC